MKKAAATFLVTLGIFVAVGVTLFIGSLIMSLDLPYRSAVSGVLLFLFSWAFVYVTAPWEE